MSLRIALSTYSMYGAWFALRLLSEGHKVQLYLSSPDYSDILEGIVPPPRIFNGHPSGHKDGWPLYEKYDLSLFDLTGRSRLAEYSHKLTPTLGDGMFNCQAEDDRFFGLRAMSECGISVPEYERFLDTGAAKSWVKKSNKRYVYKPDGGQDQDTETTYVSSSAEDMLANLDKLFVKTNGAPFILQEFIKGIEVSTEGYFNGEDFYLLNCTLEEKKFMNDNHGPNTGCAGNLVFPIREVAPIYTRGLKLMKGFLKDIGYRGMLDLNTIVNFQGVWGLEWTPRFGYDASATLLNMYAGDLGEALHRIASGKIPETAWKAEFGVGTRLSVAPYPSEIKGKHPAGIPVKGINPSDYESIYMYDIKREKGQLVTAGHSGMLAVPLSYANSITEAWDHQEMLLDKIKVPNMQLRSDIKECTSKRYIQLQEMGMF